MDNMCIVYIFKLIDITMGLRISEEENIGADILYHIIDNIDEDIDNINEDIDNIDEDIDNIDEDINDIEYTDDTDLDNIKKIGIKPENNKDKHIEVVADNIEENNISEIIEKNIEDFNIFECNNNINEVVIQSESNARSTTIKY